MSMKVWVAGVRLIDGTGYTSVNHTAEGAETAVLEWYGQIHRHIPGSFNDLDFDDDVESFYCWHMPVGD